jgi:hypothetical protein
MRNGRNAIAALVLALTLSSPTFAGIMVTDVAPPPPPPANSQTQTAATDGIIYTDDAKSALGATDSTTEIALTLLQSVLMLL